MRCVSYTRATSSCGYNNHIVKTIQWQNEQISEYAKKNNWKIIKKYTDRKNDNREERGFVQLKEDGMQRKYDVVIVQSVFLAGRGVPYAEDVFRKILYPLGIHFVILEDMFVSTEHSEDEIKTYFKTKKYEESHYISSETQKQSFLNGYFTVHDEKYGYMLSDDLRTFCIDNEAAEMVRKIYEYINAGKTYVWIAKHFNEQGYESPTQRKARIGKKNIKKVLPWTEYSVKNIATNRAYTGKCEKYFNGERFTYEIPAIIEEDYFEKTIQLLKERNVSKKSMHVSGNPFIQRIIDKNTGKSLILRTKAKGTSKGIFTMCKGTRSDISGISFEKVMYAVVNELRLEKQMAQLVAEKIIAGEGKKSIERERIEYEKKARDLFKQLKKVEQPYIPLFCQYENGEIEQEEYVILKNEIIEGLEKIEIKFAQLMSDYNKLEKTFKLNNPWIKLYANAEIPDVLTREKVRELALYIEVENFQKVHVITKYKDWREDIPSEWMKGVKCHGEKK